VKEKNLWGPIYCLPAFYYANFLLPTDGRTNAGLEAWLKLSSSFLASAKP
jgi:hypothetical protein